MTDLALFWDAERFAADLGLAAGALASFDLATDDGLRSAVLISLFTDARARADDPLPEGTDRRGWWGDALSEPGDGIGSRLWLLAREKQLASVVERAREYCREALLWLVSDRVAARVDVEAAVLRPGVLALAVTIARPAGERRRFDFAWSAEEAA